MLHLSLAKLLTPPVVLVSPPPSHLSVPVRRRGVVSVSAVSVVGHRRRAAAPPPSSVSASVWFATLFFCSPSALPPAASLSQPDPPDASSSSQSVAVVSQTVTSSSGSLSAGRSDGPLTVENWVLQYQVGQPSLVDGDRNRLLTAVEQLRQLEPTMKKAPRADLVNAAVLLGDRLAGAGGRDQRTVRDRLVRLIDEMLCDSQSAEAFDDTSLTGEDSGNDSAAVERDNVEESKTDPVERSASGDDDVQLTSPSVSHRASQPGRSLSSSPTKPPRPRRETTMQRAHQQHAADAVDEDEQREVLRLVAMPPSRVTQRMLADLSDTGLRMYKNLRDEQAQAESSPPLPRRTLGVVPSRPQVAFTFDQLEPSVLQPPIATRTSVGSR